MLLYRRHRGVCRGRTPAGHRRRAVSIGPTTGTGTQAAWNFLVKSLAGQKVRAPWKSARVRSNCSLFGGAGYGAEEVFGVTSGQEAAVAEAPDFPAGHAIASQQRGQNQVDDIGLGGSEAPRSR